MNNEREFICLCYILFTTMFKGCRNVIVMIFKLTCEWLKPGLIIIKQNNNIRNAFVGVTKMTSII